jgi:D-tyrosyl-tRNA(Tyr) deacylase
MIVALQRVTQASVEVEGSVVGSIGRGMLLLVGLEKGDSEEALEKAAQKIASLRIFDDAQGKMNLSISETGGEILCVSQFTLAADIRRGNRPSFDPAMPPEEAAPMFDQFVQTLKGKGITVHTGIFGARMKVALVNDGPVTILGKW